MANASPPRDDVATLSAIAVLAACLATIAHEAIGHGGACLASGGFVAQLSSVYFHCSAPGAWIDASGPIGNLAAAALTRIGLAFLPRSAPGLRLFLFLTMAFSLFWFAGYLIYSAALGEGDLFFVARDLTGPPSAGLRIGAVGLGLILYWIGLRETRVFAASLSGGAARARRVLRVSWLAAAVSACLAAAAYAPGPAGAIGQAALEIGAASLPLLVGVPASANFPVEEPIARSWVWLIAAVLAFLLFVVTLGRGLAW